MTETRIHALAQALRQRGSPAQSGESEGKPPTRGGPRNDPNAGPIARASVALLVRPARADLELLVIKRATRADDPWSGHMAFPGGKREPADRTARETAERETREEIGIDLRTTGRFLGPLDEVWPRSGAPAIVVSPFVYSVPATSPLSLNAEVADAFWIPVSSLSAPGAATEYLHALASGEELRFPAIAYESYVIWGLTHRIMTEFLDIVRESSLDNGTPVEEPSSPDL